MGLKVQDCISRAMLFICFIIAVLFDNKVAGRPMKVFAKGYNSRSLPPGGWTQWFNVDYPHGAGDFETYANVVRLYGRTCMGIPCRHPLAVKAVSIYGRSPRLNGDHVIVTPRQGLKCHTSHQTHHKCNDYKVRFYCPNLHLKCSSSQFYPQHRKYQNTTLEGERSISNEGNYTISTGTTTPKPILKTKAIKKKLKLLKKQRQVQKLNQVTRKKQRKLRKRMVNKRTTQRSTALPTTWHNPRTADVFQRKPAVLSSHPRHQIF